MPDLQVSLRMVQDRQLLPPGEVAIEAVFTNPGPGETRLNLHQASHPALVLEITDEKGERAPLQPPSAPDAEDLAPGQVIAPGQSASVTYAGFLDRSLPAGLYRVRYAGRFEPLGGNPSDPLFSDLIEIRIGRTDFPLPAPLPLPRKKIPIIWPLLDFLARWWHWLICFILRVILRRQCDKVLDREVDEARTETISNAPAGSEAWNGTYGWRARFQARVDQPNCRITVTVRVRLNGNITNAQRAAWETAIENAWSKHFKLCCRCCCCTNGYTMVFDIQFVTSGEHQVVNVGASTTNMGNWGAADTVDINHEFGHMLGALDEYFTVNGVNYGAGRQAGGNIMNNPANAPAAHHYDLIRATAADLLGTTCSTIPAGQAC